jgi:hypothetical protein
VLTGPDVGIITGEIGTKDPTEWRSDQAVAALLHFRHNVVEGFNTKARTQAGELPEGRKIARWEPPLDTEPAPKSPELLLVEQLKTKPNVSRDDARAEGGHDWIASQPSLPRDQLGQVLWTPDVRAGYNAAAQQAENERHEIAPAQRRGIAALVERARVGDDKTRTRVAELLDGIAKDGSSARIRDLARQGAAEARIIATPPGPGYEPPQLPRFDLPRLPTFPAPPLPPPGGK